MSHVSQIGLTRSERHGARGGNTVAVDLRSLQPHHEIASLPVGTHSLESFVVEHLAEGAQRYGAMKVAITDELGLDLRRREELHSTCLHAWCFGNVEIYIQQLLLGRAVGKLFDILAELLNILGGKPIHEAFLHHLHCLGIQSVVVDGVVERGVDMADVEWEEAAVARLVGEKLELVARGTIRCNAHTPFLGAVR